MKEYKVHLKREMTLTVSIKAKDAFAASDRVFKIFDLDVDEWGTQEVEEVG